MFDVTASIVLYCNKRDILLRTIHSFLAAQLNTRLILIDNSPTDALRDIISDARCAYYFTGFNAGFGRGHNMAISKVIGQTRYHLVLNPDIVFSEGVLRELVAFMEDHPKAGLVMPLVVDRHNRIQHVARRLPSPADLIIRRIGPDILKKLFARRLSFHEMKDQSYQQPFDAPSLSGCFMFFRAQALRETGLFDERFFLYMEDIDLSRRMRVNFRTMCNPNVRIVHEHARESYRLNRMLLVHVASAIKYFNKWGWFFDKER